MFFAMTLPVLNEPFVQSLPAEAYFPKRPTGFLYSFGLPGEDEISRMGAGDE